MLRWASPVYHFRRTATRDVELGGKEIKEGDKVVMWFASGNRDEDVFEDPYRFDVTRTNIDHMTFGKGSPHLCLGNNLARMEIRLMFEELLPRLGRRRARRRRQPRPQQLRQRHQEVPGPDHREALTPTRRRVWSRETAGVVARDGGCGRARSRLEPGAAVWRNRERRFVPPAAPFRATTVAVSWSRGRRFVQRAPVSSETSRAMIRRTALAAASAATRTSGRGPSRSTTPCMVSRTARTRA